MRARSGTARALGVLALVVLTAAACGSSAPTTLDGAPGGYLITLGQLTSPDFTVYQAVKQVGSGWLDEASSTAVRKGPRAMVRRSWPANARRSWVVSWYGSRNGST